MPDTLHIVILHTNSILPPPNCSTKYMLNVEYNGNISNVCTYRTSFQILLCTKLPTIDIGVPSGNWRNSI